MPVFLGLLTIIVIVFLARKRKKNTSNGGDGVVSNNLSPSSLPSDIDAELANEQAAYDSYMQLPQLAPEELGGYPLTYHYKDVNLRVANRVNGEFENGNTSVKRLGIKRGDMLLLVPNNIAVTGVEDLENVAVYWGNIQLGDMRMNRMRIMVRQWLANSLPVYCAMGKPTDDRDFFVEIGFYGKPSSKR